MFFLSCGNLSSFLTPHFCYDPSRLWNYHANVFDLYSVQVIVAMLLSRQFSFSLKHLFSTLPTFHVLKDGASHFQFRLKPFRA